MPLYDNEIVSVITPVYNVGKVIGKTIESMLAQGYDDLEIVLVDDCSKDNSAEVIAGPFGSAFSNIIFCKPGTKMLLFCNFSRFYEAWLCLHKKYFNLDMLWVTGFDDKTATNPSHCSFYIPLQKIKDAAKYLGIV